MFSAAVPFGLVVASAGNGLRRRPPPAGFVLSYSKSVGFASTLEIDSGMDATPLVLEADWNSSEVAVQMV